MPYETFEEGGGGALGNPSSYGVAPELLPHLSHWKKETRYCNARQIYYYGAVSASIYVYKQ